MTNRFKCHSERSDCTAEAGGRGEVRIKDIILNKPSANSVSLWLNIPSQ